MYIKYHSHSICGSTSFNDGHIHHYGSVTELAPGGVPHIHKFNNITTYNDGHAHPYCSETGPAIAVENGRHYHEYYARAEYVDGHIHHIQGCTSTD